MTWFTKTLAASTLAGLAAAAAFAETIGPNGESGIPTSSVFVTDDQAAEVQAAKYSAALPCSGILSRILRMR